MNFNSPLKLFFAGLVAGAVVASLSFMFFKWGEKTTPQVVSIQDLGNAPAAAVDCSVKNGEKTVSGNSLGNVLKDGAKVKTIENYYACKPAARGDIVEYQSGASATPLVKIVKAVPGDAFDLKKSVGGSGWNILINGKVLNNSDGKPYLLDDHGYQILSMYVHDYKGVIPPDAYLIMGESTGGSLDSSRFGLVGKSDFLGKISP